MRVISLPLCYPKPSNLHIFENKSTLERAATTAKKYINIQYFTFVKGNFKITVHDFGNLLAASKRSKSVSTTLTLMTHAPLLSSVKLCENGKCSFPLTTGTVTGCLDIPPYVTIDPPILK